MLNFSPPKLPRTVAVSLLVTEPGFLFEGFAEGSLIWPNWVAVMRA